MPFLNDKYVRQVFQFLIDDLGFEEPKVRFVGRDYVVSFRKTNIGISLIAEMGSAFPSGYVEFYGDSIHPKTSVDFDALITGSGDIQYHARYPIHELVLSSSWLQSRYLKWKYRVELEREYEQRISDLALFLRDHFDDIVQNRIQPTYFDVRKREEGIELVLDKVLRIGQIIAIASSILLLGIAFALYLFVPDSNVWKWSLYIGALSVAWVVWASIKRRTEKGRDLEIEGILEKYKSSHPGDPASPSQSSSRAS